MRAPVSARMRRTTSPPRPITLPTSTSGTSTRKSTSTLRRAGAAASAAPCAAPAPCSRRPHGSAAHGAACARTPRCKEHSRDGRPQMRPARQTWARAGRPSVHDWARARTGPGAASRCGGSASRAGGGGAAGASRSARPPCAGAAQVGPSRNRGAAAAPGPCALALAVMAMWRPCPHAGGPAQGVARRACACRVRLAHASRGQAQVKACKDRRVCSRRRCAHAGPAQCGSNRTA